MGELDGKVAFVTGAGSGIGQAQATLFAKEGAKVIVADINFEGVQAVADQIQSEGGSALAVSLDIANLDNINKAVKLGLETFDKVDILCNTAGVNDHQLPFSEFTVELLDKILDVNIRGTILLTRSILPQMVKRGEGTVINISSVAGLTSKSGGVAYTVAKHGLVGFTKQLSAEYGPKGIKVNSIAPGAIKSGMTDDAFENDAPTIESITSVPAGRYGYPEEIANASLFLASNDSDFIHGTVLPIDGGWLIK